MVDADDDGAAPAMPGELVDQRLRPDGGCVLKCEPSTVMILLTRFKGDWKYGA
jgi:hypothetical protein